MKPFDVFVTSSRYKNVSIFVLVVTVLSCAAYLLIGEERSIYLLTNPNFNSTRNSIISCGYGQPCKYPETVDFRVIVITYNRAASLQILLDSLNTLEMDGDTARLEIWIDRSKKGVIDNNTLAVARAFEWKPGPTRVHMQEKNAGIYGQWINTWSPNDASPESKEIGVIFEDDIVASPFIYRWLKAVHRYYGKMPEYFGASLTSDEQRFHAGSMGNLVAPKNDTAFLYKCIGTWGLSPKPFYWNLFQKWFHRTQDTRPDFHPYVPGIHPTTWYQDFEKSGTADSMWEMWLIYYTFQERLFTIYNNLPTLNGDKKSCLSINRREVGLHNSQKGNEHICELLKHWKDDYVSFPQKTVTLDWDGKVIESY